VAKGLEPQEVEAEWKHLHGLDVPRAYRALWSLAGSPQQALAKLQGVLQPVQPADPKVLAQWIADLESEKFAVRQKAMGELKKAGDLAWPALLKVLDQQPALELQTRARQLLGNQDDPLPLPERLPLLRSLELLEQLPTHEARALAQSLAEGAPQAWLTQQAKKLVQRSQGRR
jgi:hypothetical protein